MRVVTYEAPANGSAPPATIEVCLGCERRSREGKIGWPRDHHGTEFCRVVHGIHRGECRHPEHAPC